MEAESGRSAGQERAAAPRLVIDPETIALAPDRIVVRHRLDGGYVCIGIGRAAQFLRALDEDAAFRAAADRLANSADPPASRLAKSGDPFLRRLAAATVLAKGFDPDEPRDERGRWTSEGAVGVLHGSLRDLFDAGLPANVVRALRILASGLGAAADFASVVLIPTNRSLITEGSVPGVADLSYHYDDGTGVLTLIRQGTDGSKEVIFAGRHGADDLFRDSAGNVIARHLDTSVMLNSKAISEEFRSDADDDDKPQLCPDPSPAEPNWHTHSPRALAYQAEITGLEPGLAVRLNGVVFDGCRWSNGHLLEATGEGYLWGMIDDDTWRGYYDGVDALMVEARKHSIAAGTREIEWHFADEPVANYFRQAFKRAGLDNITVYYTPPSWRKILGMREAPNAGALGPAETSTILEGFVRGNP